MINLNERRDRYSAKDPKIIALLKKFEQRFLQNSSFSSRVEAKDGKDYYRAMLPQVYTEAEKTALLKAGLVYN